MISPGLLSQATMANYLLQEVALGIFKDYVSCLWYSLVLVCMVAMQNLLHSCASYASNINGTRQSCCYIPGIM